MKHFLSALSGHPARAENIFAFELKLLRELGLEPDWSEARLTVGARQIASTFLDGGWTGISRLKLSVAQVNELRQFLHGFLIFHLEKLPVGRAQALAIGI